MDIENNRRHRLKGYRPSNKSEVSVFNLSPAFLVTDLVISKAFLNRVEQASLVEIFRIPRNLSVGLQDDFGLAEDPGNALMHALGTRSMMKIRKRLVQCGN